MSDPDATKSTTRQILIFEPDEEQLSKQLVDREISPELRQFLNRLVKGKKWPRKINIPSSHDNLAAACVFSSELKQTGFEIFCELYVFFEGKTMVEKWQVVGQGDQISALPKETFTLIEIEKVRLEEGTVVAVTINIPAPGGRSKTVVKKFDFGGGGEGVRVVRHPLLEEEPGTAESR